MRRVAYLSHKFFGQSHTHCVRLYFCQHFISFCPAFVAYDAVNRADVIVDMFCHALGFVIF